MNIPKSLIRKDPRLKPIYKYYADMIPLNKAGFFSVRIFDENNKEVICECSFKVLDSSTIRPIETSDYFKDKAILTIHNGLYTHKNYRRQKLATSLYILAENLSGKKMIPSNDRTPEAKKFWNQASRPFG